MTIPPAEDTDAPTPTILCSGAEYVPPERARCACLIHVQVADEIDNVRACFEGHLLGRGEAIGRLTRERRARLFPPPTRTKCGVDHADAAQRLILWARTLNIPALDEEESEQNPKLAQARIRARHAVDRLAWHEVRRLVLEVKKIEVSAPIDRADKIRSIATGIWLRRGEKPRGRSPAGA